MSPDEHGLPRERIVESHRIFQGRVFDVRLDTVERENGHRYSREVVEHSQVVAIVPIDTEGRLLLVRQYRAPAEEVMLEIPAGGVDSGETLEQAVQRELQEETGQRAGRLERLCGFYASPGYSSEFIHVFLATDLTSGHLPGDEEEAIVVERLPLKEALTKIETGEIRDGKSIVGLLMAAGRGIHNG